MEDHKPLVVLEDHLHIIPLDPMEEIREVMGITLVLEMGATEHGLALNVDYPQATNTKGEVVVEAIMVVELVIQEVAVVHIRTQITFLDLL